MGMRMRYRIIFGCPNDPKLINRLIDAASKAGAGRAGSYTRVATVSMGYGTWKAEKGAHPHIGKVGAISKVPSVTIDMPCSSNRLRAVYSAIKKAHPYEEPLIEVIKLVDV